MKRIHGGFLIATVALFAAACAPTQTRMASSSYAFLYPDKVEKIEEPGLAVLNLPVRVGIAFVPESNANHWATNAIPEARKRELLERVAAAFEGQDFIASIEVIPSAYLRPEGSFTNLDQLSTMYDVDIVALVSYDQVQTTDQGVASFSYWTIVGAYVVPGEKNTTSVLMDTVVYDIASRRMLFRAPGTSEVKGLATPVNKSEALRADSEQALSIATDEMVRNLVAELERFRQKVKDRPEDFQVVRPLGYTNGGGGAPGVVMLLSLLAVVPAALNRRGHCAS